MLDGGDDDDDVPDAPEPMGMSQREVARELGVTFQTIQYIEKRALRKLARVVKLRELWK